MRNYIFGQYTLKHGQTLYYDEKIVNLPPKELKVLRLLLDHEGEVVNKETILMEVWRSDQVSDESLTRCVYVLRKILRESTSTKYIETVYGKGYRFVMRVTKNDSVAKSGNENNLIKVAIFPFKMRSHEESLLIFDYIQNLGYERIYANVFLMVSAMTIDNDKFIENYHLLRDAGVHYFITGIEVSTKYRSWIRIEITKSDSMIIVGKKKVLLDKDLPVTLLQINSAFKDIIRDLSSSVYLSDNELESNFDCGTCLKEALFSESKFRNDYETAELSYFDTSEICNSIGFYLSLELFGIIQKEKVEDFISNLISDINVNTTECALTMSLNALSLKHGNVSAQAQFESAMFISPFSVEVYFLYVCYLVKSNSLDEAGRVLKMIDYINPDFFSVKILFVSLSAYSGNSENAIHLAESYKGINKCGDNILDCLLSIIFHHTDQDTKRDELLNAIKKNSVHCSFCYNLTSLINIINSSYDSDKKNEKTKCFD
ncbi:winged helix-turn-helix domain-containing protein [Pantoea agglomerans]|jgi:DNA-binding winged helix-turn-helix (wHTH) protein|uniref:winged helix-turn-helix domain-containing protein n=1 Tax=Enterobacter agglomerans TaxID=549 RepID=UPI0013BC1797|nr:winged helix-turn-helix domain-containing protein [Pantoea agglomerans]MDQ0430943.1 DNA-binding winged helix-turn-helix (wHTH) protein [Pantoea agglomerans]NEG84904.1 hypothetical protein [Pantoea agglomerans]NEH09071.1 hypothetical protein [Pantoea agglomerans]